jgi:hypothetical protein
MDIALGLIATVTFVSGMLLLIALVVGDHGPAWAAGFVFAISAAILIPVSVVAWRANGERLAQESAVCTEAGNLWAHDEEACITPEGWTIDVR